MTEKRKPKMRRILQIACGDVFDYVENDWGTSTRVKRNTLFVLTDDGKIWTRCFHDGSYQEWFTISQDIEYQ